MALLEVKDLTLHFKVKGGWVYAVEDVNFALEPGETLGLVGESGCGKTTLGYGISQLLPDNAHVKGGQVLFKGQDILTPSVKKNGTLNAYRPEIRELRWKEISMIFQGAMNAFNPVLKVGDQIVEAIRVHDKKITWDIQKYRFRKYCQYNPHHSKAVADFQQQYASPYSP